MISWISLLFPLIIGRTMFNNDGPVRAVTVCSNRKHSFLAKGRILRSGKLYVRSRKNLIRKLHAFSQRCVFPALNCNISKKINIKTSNFDTLNYMYHRKFSTEIRVDIVDSGKFEYLKEGQGRMCDGGGVKRRRDQFSRGSQRAGGQSYDPANRTREFISGGKRDRYAHGSEFKSQWPVNINALSNER